MANDKKSADKAARPPEIHEIQVKHTCGKATLTLRREGKTFYVTDFRCDDNADLHFGFRPTPGFEDLDGKSDIAQCFNLSCRMRYGTVTVSNSEMRASSIEELRDALSKVKIGCYDPEAI